MTSLLTQVFLNCLPVDVNNWTETLIASREKYSQIKQRNIYNPRNDEGVPENLQLENPLSQSDQVSLKTQRKTYFSC